MSPGTLTHTMRASLLVASLAAAAASNLGNCDPSDVLRLATASVCLSTGTTT